MGQFTSIMTAARRTLSWSTEEKATESSVQDSPRIGIRKALKCDMNQIMTMINEHAEYENATDQVLVTPAVLERDFASGNFECFVAATEDGEIKAYALYFQMYCSWEGQVLYLDDLYVKPSARGKGIGLSLVSAVAQVAKERGCTRLQWQCAEHNKKALAFYYQRVGAIERVEKWPQPEGSSRWVDLICRTAQIDLLVSMGDRPPSKIDDNPESQAEPKDTSARPEPSKTGTAQASGRRPTAARSRTPSPCSSSSPPATPDGRGGRDPRTRR